MLKNLVRNTVVVVTFVAVLAMSQSVLAEAFADYTLAGSFSLPASGVYDVLGDGRLIALDGADVYVESGVQSRTFEYLGTLPAADMPDPQYMGPAFVRVSPDGTRIAVGNNGGLTWTNYQVGVFSINGLTGDWFTADHYEAEWVDDTNLSLTAGTFGPTAVTVLDTSSNPSSPTNPTVVTNIGGCSAGITFDALGNLYTGNGFAFGGPSDTGWVKGFSYSAWSGALSGGPIVDFETDGELVADLLSAATLGFDAEGNLYVGGGDLYGGTDNNYAGLVSSDAVSDALAGLGAADPLDPSEVRKFDPDAGSGSSYDVNYNAITGEMYLREGSSVYAYVVPEPATAALLVMGMMLVTHRRPSWRIYRGSAT